MDILKDKITAASLDHEQCTIDLMRLDNELNVLNDEKRAIVQDIEGFKNRARHIQSTLSFQTEAVSRSVAEEVIAARLESYRRLDERLRLSLSSQRGGGMDGGAMGGRSMGGGAMRGRSEGGRGMGGGVMTLGGTSPAAAAAAEEGLIGPLCDLFVPLDPQKHQVALLAVMGSTLTNTVVVHTRTLAVAAANNCREVGIAGVTFDILEEVVMVSERGGMGNGERRGEERQRER